MNMALARSLQADAIADPLNGVGGSLEALPAFKWSISSEGVAGSVEVHCRYAQSDA